MFISFRAGQVFRGQGRTEVCIPLPYAGQNLLFERRPACGSTGDLAARELRHHPRVLPALKAAAGPDGRLPSNAQRPPLASNAFALPRATPSVDPVLAGSRRYAPSPWAPQPMKADISTLLKPDILILRLH